MDINVDNDTYIPDSDNEENFLTNILKDMKLSFVALLIIIIGIYVGIFMLIGNNASNSGNNPIKNIVILILEIILWGLLLYIIYINIKNYDTKNYDFQQKIENLFNTKIAEMTIKADKDDKDDDIKNKDKSKNKDKTKNCDKNNSDKDKEVYHIFGNKYKFNEAEDICKKYNGRLASYEEIERAYDNGANWCSYGWSQDQLALFPTQLKVYNELKSIPGHEHDCGRPGINGGYISNPNITFGINCYGVKPKAKDPDKKLMHSINHTYPNSPYVKNDENNKNNKEDELSKYIIYPFNKDKWTITNS
jgi:hypothetical protein